MTPTPAHHQQHKPADQQQHGNRQVPDVKGGSRVRRARRRMVIESLRPTTATAKTAIPAKAGRPVGTSMPSDSSRT
jgi:hypothetical protein